MLPTLGNRRGLPLAARLAAILTVASLLVALLVAFLAAENEGRDRIEQADQATARFAGDLAERMAPLLERGDLLRLSVLASTSRDLVRGRVLVLDGTGKVCIDTAWVQGGRQLGLLALGGAFQRPVEREGGAALRETLVPVRHGGEPIGELRIQTEAPSRHAGFDLDLFATVFLCCLSLVALATIVGHHWLARVRRATHALIQMASGTVGHGLETDAPGELSELQSALRELDRGMQEGLSRVAEGFVAMALQVVDGLERRGLVPPGHGERTARYAELLAARLGLLPQDRRDLETACRLHDLGKAWVRPSILSKQGPLDDVERESLRQHPMRAAAYLETMPSLRRVALIVRHQHERHGGSGHPDGLRGDRIPLGARILAIAATYDLLTVCAVDERPLDSAAALARLADDRGEVFDPWLLELFGQELQKAPPQPDDRPVMISPAGVVALRAAVGDIDSRIAAELGDDLDLDPSADLELMLDDGQEERA